MKISDILFYRLRQQHLLKPLTDKPESIVKWFGAVQAQDYFGALWAVGLRLKNSTEKSVEDALVRKAIIRTWPMRGTLHFVAAEDARWMLKLLSPRVVAAQARRLKKDYDLDDRVLSRSEKILVRALQGSRQRTRDAVYDILEKAKIPAYGQRGLHIVWQLAQKGVLCFGTREGKQHTFTLLDEWIPATKNLSRNESLAKLASIYFTGYSPTTVHDFSWWSGLSLADAKAGYEMVKLDFAEEKIADRVYIMPRGTMPAKRSSSGFLLPSYDEYTVGYTDRSATLDFDNGKKHGNGIFNPIVVIDGKIVGTWKRTLKKDVVSVAINPFYALTKPQKKIIENKAEEYRKFLGAEMISVRFVR